MGVVAALGQGVVLAFRALVWRPSSSDSMPFLRWQARLLRWRMAGMSAEALMVEHDVEFQTESGVQDQDWTRPHQVASTYSYTLPYHLFILSLHAHAAMDPSLPHML